MDCEEGWAISASELYQCFRNFTMKIIYDDIGKKYKTCLQAAAFWVLVNEWCVPVFKNQLLSLMTHYRTPNVNLLKHSASSSVVVQYIQYMQVQQQLGGKCKQQSKTTV